METRVGIGANISKNEAMRRFHLPFLWNSTTICLLILLGLPKLDFAQNFVNGSFESWGSASCDINTPPDLWNNYSNGGLGPDEARFPSCPSTIPTAAQNGVTYARYYAASTTTGEGQSQIIAGFTIGNAYQVRYYYCGSNLYGGTADNRVHLFLNGVDVHQSPVFASTLLVWTLATFNFTATLATNDFGFRMYNNLASTGSGALDNLSIGTVLPSTQFAFEATPKSDGTVELNWSVLTEENGDVYVVERMEEGKNWEDILQKNGEGSSANVQDYRAIDENPIDGNSQYRIRKMDRNGGFCVSEIREVNMQLPARFSLSPNPTNGNFVIEGSNIERAAVEIVDVLGQPIYLSREVEGSSLLFDGAALDPGIYYVRIRHAHGLEVKKLVVSR